MGQRTPITAAEKKKIQEKKAIGISLREISIELQCSIETVRKWWRYGRDRRSVQARGRPKKGALSTYSEEVCQKAVELKQAHPHWGPKRVLLEMKQVLSVSEKDLPSPARLSVLFKQRCPEAIQPRQARLLPPPDLKVKFVHQRWQVDAVEGIAVGAERANVEEIRDIFGGLMIVSQAFVTAQTSKGWQHLHLEEHQQALRQGFCQWGLPSEVQTDNDPVFAHQTDPSFPTLFTLWLIGLGITHIRSRPHRPTDQPQVERNHRTQGDFVWKDQSFSQFQPFQQALDHNRQLYNEEYPSQAAHCHGVPPLSAFPTARTTGRPFHPALEWDLFDLPKVDAFLAQQVWTRKVAENGAVHLGDHYYLLGRVRKSSWVSIRFLATSRSFRFEMNDGSLICEKPALGLEKEQIIGLIPVHIPLHLGFQPALPGLGV
jgi:transposase